MFPECTFLQIETFEVQFTAARWEHHLVRTGSHRNIEPSGMEGAEATTELFIPILYVEGVH